MERNGAQALGTRPGKRCSAPLAVLRALGATRIVLNTCTLDAPQALPNYLARGFTIVSEDQYLLDVPEVRTGSGASDP